MYLEEKKREEGKERKKKVLEYWSSGTLDWNPEYWNPELRVPV